MSPAKGPRTLFRCTACGHESRRWLGRCPDCGAWDTLAEEAEQPRGGGGAAAAAARPQPLTREDSGGERRLVSGIGELDRVLGGGLVPGAVILIGGDPGIGKSTLILQVLAAIADQAGERGRVLYVTAEESAGQVRMRARRLGALRESILLAVENSVEAITAMMAEHRPVLVAVDSIQTVHTQALGSAPGSVGQVRECAARLVEAAKRLGPPLIVVGHVTKDGAIAGPRVLEHMVDTVLYFEGDRGHVFRILRTVKNRFGSTNEIGVFEMKEEGLAEVANPSELFLAERPTDQPGSVVLPTMEGTRPILVEVQALAGPGNAGAGRRTAIGADQQRLALLTAVLEKKLGLNLFGHDIFLNIAGGIRIDEPALDLGVVTALVSSLREEAVDPGTVVCGEVGLAGEVRAVGQMEQRLAEARRLGFTRFIMPRSSLRRAARSAAGMDTVGVGNIQELLLVLFGQPISNRHGNDDHGQGTAAA